MAPKPLLAPATATRGGPRICLVASRTLKDAGRTRRCDVNLLPGGGQEGLLFAFSLLELAVVALRVGHVFAEGDPDERDEDEVGDRDGADGRVGEGRGGCVCRITRSCWFSWKESRVFLLRELGEGVTHEQRGNRA